MTGPFQILSNSPVNYSNHSMPCSLRYLKASLSKPGMWVRSAQALFRSGNFKHELVEQYPHSSQEYTFLPSYVMTRKHFSIPAEGGAKISQTLLPFSLFTDWTSDSPIQATDVCAKDEF